MLEIRNITFGYDKKVVLNDFSMKLEKGGVYGLLGKNGTGKSTLLYLIMGLLRPKSGEVLFNGQNTFGRNPDVLKHMFIVPEEYDLPNTTLSAYIKRIRPFYPNFDEQILKDCLEVFEMPADVNMKSLSMGQKKKIYISLALAIRAELLVMDEPTIGLDIPAKSQFRKAIARGMSENQTILISTHQVRDVELLLDHVTIINQHGVLLNEPINTEEPTDLEKLFLDTLATAGE